MSRKIIHIDMDAFFAAVEQRDNPELEGLPVVVGGQPDSRGVVATCSYEARQFGIRSAMPCSRAYKLCPQARFVRPRFAAYKQASEEIRKIFSMYTDLIEPLSLDEAYLDVSDIDLCNGSASLMAKEIRARIFESLQLTASAGVSYNKFLAKLASDHQKPNGQFVIKPGEAEGFLESMPIGRFFGVGKVTEARMHALKIMTGGDLKKLSLHQLQNSFGNSAEYYYQIARGIDNRPVNNVRIRKSMASETTFEHDISDVERMLQRLEDLGHGLIDDLVKRDLLAYTITIKVKYADFKQVTRSYTADTVISDHNKMTDLVKVLLAKTEVQTRSVRLLGVAFSNLVSGDNDASGIQLSLF